MGAGHRWQSGACALHVGYLRLEIHSGCVILIAFPLQQWLPELASVLRCTYIVFRVCPNVVDDTKIVLYTQRLYRICLLHDHFQRGFIHNYYMCHAENIVWIDSWNKSVMRFLKWTCLCCAKDHLGLLLTKDWQPLRFSKKLPWFLGCNFCSYGTGNSEGC
jgi:hypothetical protein